MDKGKRKQEVMKATMSLGRKGGKAIRPQKPVLRKLGSDSEKEDEMKSIDWEPRRSLEETNLLSPRGQSGSRLPATEPSPQLSASPPQAIMSSASKPSTISTPKSRPPLFPDSLSSPSTSRQSDIALSLLDHLGLLQERTESASAYLMSLRKEVESKAKGIISSLIDSKGKLIREIDRFLDDQKTIITTLIETKQRELAQYEDKLTHYGGKIYTAVKKLRDYCDGKERNYRESIRLAEEVVDLPSPDIPFTWEWTEVPNIPFPFTLHRHKSKNCMKPYHVTSEITKDKLVLDLLQSYKQLEALYYQNRKEDVCMEKEESAIPSVKHAMEDNEKLRSLMEQNRILAQRIASLESAVKTRSSEPSLSQKPRVTISALRSESRAVPNTLIPDPGLRLYVPYGHPAYSYFYYLTMEEDVTVAELLSFLSIHMKTTGREELCIAMKRTQEAQEVRLYNSERPCELLGVPVDGWPRLYLSSE